MKSRGALCARYQLISKHVESCRESCRQTFTTQLRVVGRDLVERVPIRNGEVFRNDTLIEISVIVPISF